MIEIKSILRTALPMFVAPFFVAVSSSKLRLPLTGFSVITSIERERGKRTYSIAISYCHGEKKPNKYGIYLRTAIRMDL